MLVTLGHAFDATVTVVRYVSLSKQTLTKEQNVQCKRNTQRKGNYSAFRFFFVISFNFFCEICIEFYSEGLND